MMSRLTAAFFATGFAALLCQIVWQRMLGIFAGSDTISAALVVGAFLAGLGLGSIIGAKIADRLTAAQALVGFALAEVGVGIFALASKAFLYDWLATDLAGVVDAAPAIFALCFAGLVLPTTLMGASLPLLARAVATDRDRIAERIGTLYGLNTLGAGIGALLGGWVLVGHMGFVGALWLAAGLEFAAAALTLTLLPALRAAPPPPAAEARAADDGRYGGLPLWCLLVFLSGYVIVALEIVWVRMLGQVGQYHAYLFPTVLGIFLLADGLGMAVAARMVRRIEDPRPAFFITQSAGFVLATTLLLALWYALPHWPLHDLLAVDHNRMHGERLATMLALTAVVVAPPSFLIGMTFPFVQRAVQRDLSSVGARVGWVQLANIAGNAAGSILTGLVTFHLLGTPGTLRLLAVLSLLLVLFWLWRAGGGAGLAAGLRRRPVEAALAGGCAALALVIPGNAAFWTRLHAERPGQIAAWAEDRSGVAYFRDGNAADTRADGPFFIQGFSQGRIPFLPIHQFLGAVGPLIHPDPREVLVIGVGSGGTPWAAGVRPESRVRAIELVGPVLTALEEVGRRHPGSPMARMFEDPRWQLEYGDGRRTLAKEDRLYDIIEADAILPQSSHSGLLYSAEFLARVRERLAPGGMYIQWAPSGRVVETFVAAFPHVLLLMPGEVLVGSNDPIPFDPEGLARAFAAAPTVAHLRAGNPDYENWPGFFARPALMWTPETERGPATLTDVFPRDEFYMNQDAFTTATFADRIAPAMALRRAPPAR
ncbi:fused MFS/spermidine synthase [Roseomonas sp. HF4]|uniref:fused MFS/spermidine synthase n=1 Tax=Roseomonas sp. HF4 TaxID=2562313 RepID=UPI0010BFD4B0|nr:fused MFS/spermidine synthase [Roseomonas sp. HF4]